MTKQRIKKIRIDYETGEKTVWYFTRKYAEKFFSIIKNLKFIKKETLVDKQEIYFFKDTKGFLGEKGEIVTIDGETHEDCLTLGFDLINKKTL